MLRWPKTQIKAGIFPDGVMLMKVRGSSKPVILEQKWLACEMQDVGRAFGEGLKELDAGGLNCAVVLSNEYARFLVIEGHGALASRHEWSAYVDHHYEMAFGSHATAWRKSWKPTGRQRRVVASATDHALLGQVEQQCVAAGCKLRRMTPLFVAAHDLWQPSRGEQRLLFVVMEPLWLSIGAIMNGEVVKMRSARWRAERGVGFLVRLLEQEKLILGGDWWKAHISCWGIGQATHMVEQIKAMGIHVLCDAQFQREIRGDKRDYAALASL